MSAIMGFFILQNKSMSASSAIASIVYTLCLKKRLTFKLSLTLSNLNRFSKFLHC